MRSVRDPVPDVMRSLMATGRDGLLLADRVHRADDKARATLAKLEAKP